LASPVTKKQLVEQSKTKTVVIESQWQEPLTQRKNWLSEATAQFCTIMHNCLYAQFKKNKLKNCLKTKQKKLWPKSKMNCANQKIDPTTSHKQPPNTEEPEAQTES
jgi:hypothetical protein